MFLTFRIGADDALNHVCFALQAHTLNAEDVYDGRRTMTEIGSIWFAGDVYSARLAHGAAKLLDNFGIRDLTVHFSEVYISVL